MTLQRIITRKFSDFPREAVYDFIGVEQWMVHLGESAQPIF